MNKVSNNGINCTCLGCLLEVIAIGGFIYIISHWDMIINFIFNR